MAGPHSKRLTDDEQHLVAKHLAFYKSLDQGYRIPITDAQEHFVSVCRGKETPQTLHEKANIKYRHLGCYEKVEAQRNKASDQKQPNFKQKSGRKLKYKKVIYPSPMKALLDKSIWLHSRDERLLNEMKCVIDVGGKLSQKQREVLWQMFNRLRENQKIRVWRG